MSVCREISLIFSSISVGEKYDTFYLSSMGEEKKYLKLPPAWLLLFTALIRFNFQQIYQEQIFIPLESAFLETMLRYHKYFTLANKVPLSAHKHFFPPAFTLFTQIPD